MNTDGLPSPALPQIEYLVLDAGGVIFPSAMPQVIADVARRSRRSEEQLWQFFNTNLHQAFWSGELNLEEFWTTIATFAEVPGIPPGTPAAVPVPVLTPLPHAAAIRGWASLVPMAILSNQRAEWLVPALERAGMAKMFDPILISSRTGLVKPDPAALAQLTGLGVPPDTVLYVDDRAPARAAARALGIAAIAADPDGTWVTVVDARLGIRD